jgi:ABC-type Fe3+/spermidine/putrescine transport system ATPase subunit
MSLLSVSKISKQLQGSVILQDVSFTLRELQKIAIAGETGSGKSTLLKIIGGLVQKDAGEAYFDNVRIRGPLEKLMPGHPGIVYLSQHFELRNNYRVEEILEYANKLTEEDAAGIYEVCRISHLLKRKTDQLSGGEKQRIALARLLVTAPRLLLLDEPYSNLDMIHKGILKAVIHDVSTELGITCILISHDPLDMLSWADEILVMKDGQIIQQGTPEQIYSQPVNEYTGALFGKYNLIAPSKAKFLAGLPGITLNGQQLFIRPEQFKVGPKVKEALTGKVKEIRFMGSFTEMDVTVSKYPITIRTEVPGIKKGDTVYLTISPDGIWYF